MPLKVADNARRDSAVPVLEANAVGISTVSRAFYTTVIRFSAAATWCIIVLGSSVISRRWKAITESIHGHVWEYADTRWRLPRARTSRDQHQLVEFDDPDTSSQNRLFTTPVCVVSEKILHQPWRSIVISMRVNEFRT